MKFVKGVILFVVFGLGVGAGFAVIFDHLENDKLIYKTAVGQYQYIQHLEAERKKSCPL